jgi:hypothetical protein
MIPGEEEVLLPPGCVFAVTKREKIAGGHEIVYLTFKCLTGNLLGPRCTREGAMTVHTAPARLTESLLQGHRDLAAHFCCGYPDMKFSASYGVENWIALWAAEHVKHVQCLVPCLLARGADPSFEIMHGVALEGEANKSCVWPIFVQSRDEAQRICRASGGAGYYFLTSTESPGGDLYVFDTIKGYKTSPPSQIEGTSTHCVAGVAIRQSVHVTKIYDGQLGDGSSKEEEHLSTLLGFKYMNGYALQGWPNKSRGWPIKVKSEEEAEAMCRAVRGAGFHFYLAGDTAAAGALYIFDTIVGCERRQAPVRHCVSALIERGSSSVDYSSAAKIA